MAGCSEAEGKEQDSNPSAGAERGVLTVAILISGILAVAITSHLLNPKLPDGREFSEGAWYSTDVVHFCQRTLSGFDDFLAFVSSASNPAQILHRVVPLLASVKGPQVALKVLVAYVAADVSNLALKWPLQGDRHVSSYCYIHMCPHIATSPAHERYICVLILLYPHTAIYDTQAFLDG